MIVKLTHSTAVQFPEGAVVEVADEEGKRLIAFRNAVEVKAEPKAEPVKKAPAKKRSKKEI